MEPKEKWAKTGTSRGLVEFEEMEQAYHAIQDLDKIINGDSTTKLEDAWNVIAQVNKDKFDKENTDSILASIRDALCKIFIDRQSKINANVSLTKDRSNILAND